MRVYTSTSTFIIDRYMSMCLCIYKQYPYICASMYQSSTLSIYLSVSSDMHHICIYAAYVYNLKHKGSNTIVSVLILFSY